MPAPVIPAIAHQDIPINDTTEYVLNIDVTGAASCEVEGDLEGFYATFDAALSTNRLKFRGIPDTLLKDKQVTIKATNTDGTTTLTFTYSVIPNAPVITRPTGRIKFVRNKKANLVIPIANEPTYFNAYGLQVGLDHYLYEEDNKSSGIIEGTIPNNTKLVAASGNIDLDARNAGGTDTENDVPFDILTSAPQLSGLAYNSSTRTLSWTKATNARSYAIRIGATGEWLDVGDVSSYTFPASDAPVEGSTIYVRVNQAWVGDAVSVVYGTAPVIASIANVTKNSGYSQFTIQASATGTTPITWSLAGSYASISNTGLITIQAGNTLYGISYTVTATNVVGSDTETFIFYVLLPLSTPVLTWSASDTRVKWPPVSGAPNISNYRIRYRYRLIGESNWSGWTNWSSPHSYTNSQFTYTITVGNPRQYDLDIEVYALATGYQNSPVATLQVI